MSPPFTALNQRSLEAKIRTGKFRPIPERYSQDLSDVVNSMLKVNVRSTRIIMSVFDVFLFQKLFDLYDYLVLLLCMTLNFSGTQEERRPSIDKLLGSSIFQRFQRDSDTS